MDTRSAMLDILPLEILVDIILRVPYQYMPALALVNSMLNNIIVNEQYWREQLRVVAPEIYDTLLREQEAMGKEAKYNKIEWQVYFKLFIQHKSCDFFRCRYAIITSTNGELKKQYNTLAALYQRFQDQMEYSYSAIDLLRMYANQSFLDDVYHNVVKAYFLEKRENVTDSLKYWIRDEYHLLHLALECNQSLQEVQSLIEEGIDVNDQDEFGNTAIFIAAKRNDKEIMELLIKSSADINHTNKQGDTYFHVAAKYRNDIHFNIDFKNERDYQKLLLMFKPNHTSIASTPLENAGRNGHYSIVLKLMQCVEDSKKIQGYEDCITQIVDLEKIYTSAMLNAVSGNHIDIVKYFLEKNIDVDAKKYETMPSALILSVIQTNVAMTQLILQYNPALTCFNNKLAIGNDKTPLHIAAEKGLLKIVEMLVDAGADVNAKELVDEKMPEYSSDGRSVLHMAVKEGHIETVTYLLQHDADIYATDKHGHTVLHYAAAYGHPEFVEAFLDLGLDIEIKDNLKRTALYHAIHGVEDEMERLISKDRMGTVKVLLERGASIVNINGWGHNNTALDQARLMHNHKLYEMIMSYRNKSSLASSLMRDIFVGERRYISSLDDDNHGPSHQRTRSCPM